MPVQLETNLLQQIVYSIIAFILLLKYFVRKLFSNSFMPPTAPAPSSLQHAAKAFISTPSMTDHN